jgi:catechol 2,3-dioxygenase
MRRIVGDRWQMARNAKPGPPPPTPTHPTWFDEKSGGDTFCCATIAVLRTVQTKAVKMPPTSPPSIQLSPTPSCTGHGKAYRFRTPSGHVAEIFWQVERYAAAEDVRSRFRNRPQRRHAGPAGVAARFLHHVNLSSADVAHDRVFFADRLGSKTNELVKVPGKGLEIFAAMASTNVDHDLGVTIDPEGRRGLLNHVAYAVESREEVLLAADAAVEWGLTIELGPAKHGAGESFFLHVREPGTQQRIELYSGGYLNFEPDRPTIVWSVTDTPHPLLAWGGEIPASFGGGRPVAPAGA